MKRHERLEGFVVYGNLYLSVLMVQALQEAYKEQLEPDNTWISIVLGTILNVSAAGVRTRLLPPDQHTINRYEKEVTFAFCLTGFGLVIPWQIARAVWWRFGALRYREQRNRKREALHNNANDAEIMAGTGDNAVTAGD
jgi:hypothetical protein